MNVKVVTIAMLAILMSIFGRETSAFSEERIIFDPFEKNREYALTKPGRVFRDSDTGLIVLERIATVRIWPDGKKEDRNTAIAVSIDPVTGVTKQLGMWDRIIGVNFRLDPASR